MTGSVSGIKAPQSAAAREYLAQRKEIAALKARIAELEAQLAAAAPGAVQEQAALGELRNIAALIANHYADKPDSMTTSIGDWDSRDDFGLPAFSAYMAVPLADWRRYAKG